MIERVRPGVVRIRTNLGSGSGVIYSKSADGSALVLTNYHVIEDASSVDVVVDDSTRCVAWAGEVGAQTVLISKDAFRYSGSDSVVGSLAELPAYIKKFAAL